MTRWLVLGALAALVGGAGCVTMPAPTPAQWKVYTAFEACKRHSPGVALTWVGEDGSWRSRSAGSVDALAFSSCMRQQTGGNVFVR